MTNSRTATPCLAERLAARASCTAQPAAASMAVDLDPGLRLGSEVCELALVHERIFPQDEGEASLAPTASPGRL